MFSFRASSKRLLALFLVSTLALGPIGCGGEVIPVVLAIVGAAGGVAFTIHQFQQIEAARLDIELKTLQIHGIRNGQSVSTERRLSTAEVNEIASSGKVTLNGQEIRVSQSR